MKKVLGIFSAVLSVIFMFLVIKSYVNIPITRSALENCVWNRDGVYSPENEGKIVTMILDVSTLENAYDSDMDLHFKTPVVKRRVEKLVEVPTKADGEWEWTWREIYEPSEGEIGQKTFVGKVKGDALQLDSQIEKMLPKGDILGIDDLTKESQESLEGKIGVRVGISRTYFTNASHAAFSEPLISHSIINPLFHDEGKIRIWYEKIYDDNAVYAVTGVQRGKTLEKADLDMSAVNKNVSYKEELIENVTKESVLSTTLFLLGDLVLIYFSLIWLGIIKKGLFVKKKAAVTENKQ